MQGVVAVLEQGGYVRVSVVCRYHREALAYSGWLPEMQSRAGRFFADAPEAGAKS